MRYGINEALDCLEVAFDRKKIIVNLAGMVLSAGLFILVSWLGSLSGAEAVSTAANIVGLVSAWIVISLTLTAVCRMSYKELTTGEKISAAEALSFSKKHLLTSALSPALIALAAGAVLLAEYAVFMLGRYSLVQVAVSLFSIPVLLINSALILLAAVAAVFAFPIVAVDEGGIINTSKKIVSAVLSAPIKMISGVAVTLILGIPVLLALGAVLFTANISTISMFGTASGIFAAMKATEIPFVPGTTYTAWTIFLVSLSVLTGALVSYGIVYAKTAAVSIYLSIKSSLK